MKNVCVIKKVYSCNENINKEKEMSVHRRLFYAHFSLLLDFLFVLLHALLYGKLVDHVN